MNIRIKQLLVVGFIASAGNAFTEIGKVDVVISSRKIANLKIEAKFDDSAKSLFLGTTDQNCEGRIIKRDQNSATVDISKCSEVELKTGSLVFFLAEEVEQNASKPETVSDEIEKVHCFGVGFRVNSRLIFSDVKVSSGTSFAAGSLEYTVSGTPVSLEWNYSATKRNAWGWGAGVTYTYFNWDKVTASDSTGKATIAAGGTTRVISPFVNAIYRWDNVYVPMGFNVSSLSHDGTPIFINQNKGTLGAQLGLGVIVNNNFSVLFESKVFGFGGAVFTQGTTTINSEAGFASGINIMGLFSF